MPIIDPKDFERPLLPDVILAAFQGRVYLSLPELAALLEMDKRTLLAQIAKVDGLPFRQKGASTQRPRRVFSLADVELIWKQGERGCQNYPANTSRGRGLAQNTEASLAPQTEPKPKNSQGKGRKKSGA
jgi:hypothetical protein